MQWFGSLKVGPVFGFLNPQTAVSISIFQKKQEKKHFNFFNFLF